MKKFDEINIIPFIDIMLVLLTIVLVTASFIAEGKIKINVPKANSTVALKAEELSKLLTVKQSGELFYNNQPISLPDLQTEISHWQATDKVTLKVDAGATFQHFIDVTDLLSQYHITQVSIVTQKPKQTAEQTSNE